MKNGIDINRISTAACKLIMLILLLYITWIKEVYGDIYVILYGAAISMTGLAVIKCFNRKTALNKLPPIVVAYFMLAAFSFVSGLIVAKNISVLISSIVRFTAFSVVCFDVWVVSEEDKSMDWLLTIFIICAVVCTIQVLLWGENYYNGVVVKTMSRKNNPNTLGFTMLCGISASLIKKSRLEKSFAIRILLIFAFSYVIILGGSRKCFIAEIILLLGWLLSMLRSMKTSMTSKNLQIAVIMIVSIAVAICYASKYLSSTSLFARFQNMFTGHGDKVRIQLYKDAFKFWKTSPLIGIGFDQYKIWSPYKFYSHSSYAEVFACAGLIGMAIFFSPFVAAVVRILKKAGNKTQDSVRRYNNNMLGVVMMMELFIGIGQIFIYDLLHMLLLTYIFTAVWGMTDEENNEENTACVDTPKTIMDRT